MSEEATETEAPVEASEESTPNYECKGGDTACPWVKTERRPDPPNQAVKFVEQYKCSECGKEKSEKVG